jgi:hypothetical protein
MLKKNKDSHHMGSIDFPSNAVVDNEGGVDEHLLGLGGVPGIDTNPNTDEMMAASALRGVRGGPQQHLGVGSGDPSHNNGYGGFFGVNGTNGVHSSMNGTQAAGQSGFGQIEMSGFPYNQYGYPLNGNTHAMIMTQLRGTQHQQYPGFMRKLKTSFMMWISVIFVVLVILDLTQKSSCSSFRTAIDQQANLSQLASLAGVQNDVTQQQQQHLQQPIDQTVPETGVSVEMGNGNMGNGNMGNGNMGNVVLNDNSGGSNTSF